MKFAKRTRLLVAACVVGLVAGVPALADNVDKGSDGWTTPCTTMTLADSIPPGFFGSRSDPLRELDICGDPLGPPVGNGIDTIIERLEDAVLPACGSEDTIAIEMVALSLVGTATVSFDNGARFETWGVRVCLSKCHVDPTSCGLVRGDFEGSMKIRKRCTGGGTADTLGLPVLPKFKFTPQGGGPELILDTGIEGFDPADNELVGFDMGWSHTWGVSISRVPADMPLDGDCDPSTAVRNALGYSNFVAGIIPAGCTCGGGESTQQCKRLTTEELRLLRHNVLPGGTEMVGCCLPKGICAAMTAEACIEKGGDDVVMVDEGKCRKVQGCCFPDGSCEDMAPGCCECSGGAPQGSHNLCRGDSNGDGIDDLCQEFIPTVSQWGMAMLALLLLVGARVYYSRRRSVTA